MPTTAASLTLGATAPDFDLRGTDGRRHRLAELRGAKATLVMFICNHCPYVKAVLDDIIKDARDLGEHGVASVAIMPNDTEAYPDDSLENMKRIAAAKKFSFPYVIDESQEVAISSASTPRSSCNITAGSIRCAISSACRDHRASFSTPC